MSMFPSPQSFRQAALGLAALVTILMPQSAFAGTVAYEDMCARTVEVVQWTPQKGPIARFVADTFMNTGQTGVWIGLGRAGNSFWSAEGGYTNDACDDCRSLYLVETRADGTRTRHEVFGYDILRKLPNGPDPIKTHILATLWKLADKTWPTDKLTQDSSLVLGNPNAESANGKNRFAVEVRTKKVFDLHYDFDAGRDMCWCVFDWKGRSQR